MVDHVAYHHVKYVSPILSPLDALSPHPLSIDDLGRRTNPNPTNIAYNPGYRRRTRVEDPRDIYVDCAPPRPRRPLPAPTPDGMVRCMPQRRGRTSIYRDQREDETSDVSLTEEQLLLCPPQIPGFAFADKVYCVSPFLLPKTPKLILGYPPQQLRLIV